MYVCVCMCVCVSVCVCMYVCVYVCMYVCVRYDKVRNRSNKLGNEIIFFTTAESIKWYCKTTLPLNIDVTTKHQGPCAVLPYIFTILGTYRTMVMSDK